MPRVGRRNDVVHAATGHTCQDLESAGGPNIDVGAAETGAERAAVKPSVLHGGTGGARQPPASRRDSIQALEPLVVAVPAVGDAFDEIVSMGIAHVLVIE